MAQIHAGGTNSCLEGYTLRPSPRHCRYGPSKPHLPSWSAGGLGLETARTSQPSITPVYRLVRWGGSRGTHL
jgi:hypothetical protein